MLKDPQIQPTSYLIKQLPTLTVFIDRTFKIVHASDKWTITFGKDNNNTLGKSIFDVFPEVSHKWKKVLQDCFCGQAKPLGVHKHIDANQTEKWYEWSNTCWYDLNENIIGAIIQINDVTESIENELELEKTKNLLNQQSKSSKTGRWEYDIVSNKISWCDITKAVHEVPIDYIPDIDSAIKFYKEGYSRNAISMALYEASEKGTPWSEKLQITTATGKDKWVLTTGKAIFKKGELVGFSGTFQDINDQIIAHLETKKNEKLLRTLVDNLPLNVYVKDINSRKILVNKAECEFFEVDSETDLLGKNNYDLYDEETARAYTEQDIRVMTNLTPILGEELICTKKDGTQTIFLSSKIPLYDESGNANGLIGISLDITNIKQKEKELRNLIDVTSLQNKKLINFAHIVSHNLRSHTANFSMLLDFLHHEECEDEKQKILNMLDSASKNLLETIDNLNEVVAISTNVNLEIKNVNLYERITLVKKNLSDLINSNQARITNNISKDEILRAVPSYLDSILMNFITNGIKYKHPKRRPELILNLTKEGNFTILSIQDNGLGIDLKKYGNKLFGMYKTFHHHQNARGIGLYITKNQVEAMGGKIEVESEVGKGTTFKIFFNEKI
ncbi:PAS domain-containing protein [Maribacter sp. MMG018]|uniref:PAS domain-containing sensor histidine kinase n=1 Tax=Maribacter sp. MMG018 TaxID=2822688 RepID=UPI001B37284B|nr:PAS domain-containing protein [Maribacter sp. MMG018]MBQ4916176.1 PAS domain-containing protein [Maribacter sp. MMG018]